MKLYKKISNVVGIVIETLYYHTITNLLNILADIT